MYSYITGPILDRFNGAFYEKFNKKKQYESADADSLLHHEPYLPQQR